MTPRERQLRCRVLITKDSKNWNFSEFREYWTIYAEDHHGSKSAIMCILKGLKRFKIVTQINLFKSLRG